MFTTFRVAAALCMALTACSPAPTPSRNVAQDTPVEVRQVLAPQGWQVQGERPVAKLVQHNGQVLSELSPVRLVPEKSARLALTH